MTPKLLVINKKLSSLSNNSNNQAPANCGINLSDFWLWNIFAV